MQLSMSYTNELTFHFQQDFLSKSISSFLVEILLYSPPLQLQLMGCLLRPIQEGKRFQDLNSVMVIWLILRESFYMKTKALKPYYQVLILRGLTNLVTKLFLWEFHMVSILQMKAYTSSQHLLLSLNISAGRNPLSLFAKEVCFMYQQTLTLKKRMRIYLEYVKIYLEWLDLEPI